jgi:TonB-linked SusC/RagA family outer membrane protein
MDLKVLRKGVLWGNPYFQPKRRFRAHGVYKMFLAMKLTAVLVLVTTLSVSANSYSQITISQKNAPLTAVFKEMQKQSGYEFFYSYELLARQGNVTVSIKNVSLEEAIREVLKNKPLTYQVVGKTVVIKAAPAQHPITDEAASPLPITVRGRIIDEDNNPVLAVITVKGTTISVSSNSKGDFQLPETDPEATLVISALNIETQEIKLDKRTFLLIQVKKKVAELDQSVVIAYGTTTKRLNTGDVGTITSDVISKQPVFNVLQALEGRVPGMTVSQTTGVAGARTPVQIRGRANFDNSISSDQPLFILDGVPLAANNDATTSSITQVYGAATGSGMSVLAGLNPNDIASIEVLKDADATAIYGSRGANGVILITSKKGTSGKTRIDATVNIGFNKVTQLPKLLNTQDYLTMRNEAFANDGLTKNNGNAYDLLVWDTTRYTDMAKLLIGNTATVYDVQLGASGGDKFTQYRISGNYHKEGMVWAGNKSAEKAATSFNLHSTNTNQRLDFNFTGTYSLNNNNFPGLDLTSGLILPPNVRLYDSLGKLAWNEGGFSSNRDNPLAQLRQQYIARVTNLNSNMLVSYKLVKGLVVRTSVGYNVTRSDDQRLLPLASINPATTPYTGSASYANKNLRTWIIEPQAEYKTNIAQGKLDVLAGGTFNKRISQGNTIVATGYTSDQLLTSLTGTTSIGATNTYNEYAYTAFFGRINYNWRDKYIVNFTGRRDGSSRFGPGYRFSNFGAIGAAWLFSNEYLLKNVKWLSYGKIRGSYGKTGNDQIGDYRFFDTWQAQAGLSYYDSSTINVTRLYSPNLHWERNNKAEVALELGLFHDRILLTTALYRNISEEPLVTYPLSGVAGFNNVLINLEGVQVENKGIEISFNSRNMETRSFKWSTSFNITVPKNQLKKYPGLDKSSYAAKYQVGKSLNTIVGYHFAGVDPATGIGSVDDQNGDGKASTANDFVYTNLKTDPIVYGGLSNTFTYKGLSATVFFQFNKQMGANWYQNTSLRGVGTAYNIPRSGFQRSWQHPGDVADFPRFSTTGIGSLTALTGYYATYFSNRAYSDVSYIRLKNVAISYDLHPEVLKRMRFNNLRIFVQGQNLLTFTKYKDADPETQNFTVLPPMKSFMGGVQLGL